MLDRTIAPPATKIQRINIPQFSTRNLSNGVPVYFLNSGKQEVLKVDVILAAGVKYESKPGISYLVSRMLTAGTTQKDAASIATELDYYGAFFESSSSFDSISITIYCLNKFLKPVMALVSELLTESVFPAAEMATVVRQKVNELAINDKKDSQVGARRFRQNLFGLKHPYGQILTAEDVQAVTRDELVRFYKERLFNEPVVMVSGKADSGAVETICAALEGMPVSHHSPREGVIESLEQTEVLKGLKVFSLLLRWGG